MWGDQTPNEVFYVRILQVPFLITMNYLRRGSFCFWERKPTKCSYPVYYLQVIRPVPSPGVLAVLLHVSHVSVEVVLTVLARVPSVTCAVVGVCLHQLKPGATGTVVSMCSRDVLPSVLPLLPQASHPSSCQRVSWKVNGLSGLRGCGYMLFRCKNLVFYIPATWFTLDFTLEWCIQQTPTQQTKK